MYINTFSKVWVSSGIAEIHPQAHSLEAGMPKIKARVKPGSNSMGHQLHSTGSSEHQISYLQRKDTNTYVRELLK